MPSTDRSLIIGVAAGYSANQITPFLRSLRDTPYRGRVCLMIDRMPTDAVREIEKLADNVIALREAAAGDMRPRRLLPRFLTMLRNTRGLRKVYPATFRVLLRWTSNAARSRVWRELERDCEGYQSLRYLHYLEYLENFATDADRVLLTDVRDVLFQDDPFRDPPAGDLEVFLEADRVKVGCDAFNHRWVLDLYGSRHLAEIAGRTVSCSGTTMGTREGIVRYLSKMSDEILRARIPLGAHDQGIHNCLLWTGKLDPVTRGANGASAVLTLGSEPDVRRDGVGRLLNRDGTVPPIVHQYDRHPGLAIEIWKKLEASWAERVWPPVATAAQAPEPRCVVHE